MERCISKGISNVDRGAALYELCEYVVAAGFGRDMDRRLAVLVLGVPAPVANRQHLGHYVEVAGLCRPEKERYYDI